MNLSDRATEAIRVAILSWQLEPGEVVTIDKLAAFVGVSRTPVQDALRELTAEGLVLLKPQARHIVAPLSLEAVRQAFEVRMGLECVAVETAIRAPESMLAKYASPDASPFEPPPPLLENVPRPEFTDALLGAIYHNQFHLRIARLSGNARLVEAIGVQLLAVTRPLVLQATRTKAQPSMEALHADIAGAVINRDTKAAIEAMRAHLAEGFAQLKALFEEEGIEEYTGELRAEGAFAPFVGPYAEVFAK